MSPLPKVTSSSVAVTAESMGLVRGCQDLARTSPPVQCSTAVMGRVQVFLPLLSLRIACRGQHTCSSVPLESFVGNHHPTDALGPQHSEDLAFILTLWLPT